MTPLRPIVCLAAILCTSASALGIPPPPAAGMRLTGQAVLGCRSLRGTYTAFLVPSHGVAILATRSFPGGRKVGVIENGRLRFSLPGIGEREVAAAGSAPGPVWGQLDRFFDGGDRRGCVGFGPRSFSSADDFLTYLHWFLRDVLLPVTARLGDELPSLWLGSRLVSLEVSHSGARSLRLLGTEGSTLGFRVEGSPDLFLVQPFVLDEERSRVWARLWTKTGPYFGSGAPGAMPGIVIGPEAAAPLPSEVPFSLRVLAIEPQP